MKRPLHLFSAKIARTNTRTRAKRVSDDSHADVTIEFCEEEAVNSSVGVAMLGGGW